jgi:hypothetical protein
VTNASAARLIPPGCGRLHATTAIVTRIAASGNELATVRQILMATDSGEVRSPPSENAT